jgi:hypothetical protein
VPVVDAVPTRIGSETARIETPLSATSFRAFGTVRVKGSLANTGAAVVATQTLSGGPTIEVGYSAANADTGSYSMTLPAGAPAMLVYAAGATTFPFSSVGQVPGIYKLEASAPTYAVMTADITPADVTPTNDVERNFAFQP